MDDDQQLADPADGTGPRPHPDAAVPADGPPATDVAGDATAAPPADPPSIDAADVDLRRPDELESGDESPRQAKRFGTFGGVFTPTLLTILGVIMYLREGWVIGNAGLYGGLLIITLAFGITTATALSMSSITTNIRIGAGGAYAIIAQSLGLEIGGALGIPRYLSQALAVTLYVFGFREGWQFFFPTHNALVVDVTVFLVIVAIAYVSASFAIRIQFVIMVIIALSLGSIAWAAATGSMDVPRGEIELWGQFEGAPQEGVIGTTFWVVFAVFFPASTGIMAGANMSGDLKDPRRSIPRGTLAAIAVSYVVYVLLAFWLARTVPAEELVENYNAMIDNAAWPELVIAGLLGATFSSALASVVGAARILMAMGEHRVLPGSRWLARRTAGGEPRNALMVTMGIIIASIMLRDLNAIAPLVTMFFLVTYAMLNGILLVEQRLQLASFRPALSVSPWVPLVGLAGSVFAMFIIAPTLALVSVGIMVAFYALLVRRNLDAPFSDVRSGLFVAVAQWATAKISLLPGSQERAWKPSLLVPVESEEEVRGSYSVLTSLAAPNGTLRLMGVTDDADDEADDLPLQRGLEELADGFLDRGVHTTATTVRVPGTSFADGITAGMQALRGAFFRPNAMFVRLSGDGASLDDDDLARIVREGERQQLGSLLWWPHATSSLGQRRRVNVWIRERSPEWSIGWDIGNLDLSLLLAMQLARNWDADVRLVMVVEDPDDEADATSFLEDLIRLARVHGGEPVVLAGEYSDALAAAPQADVSIFGIPQRPHREVLHAAVTRTGSSCLFVRDSGNESALA